MLSSSSYHWERICSNWPTCWPAFIKRITAPKLWRSNQTIFVKNLWVNFERFQSDAFHMQWSRYFLCLLFFFFSFFRCCINRSFLLLIIFIFVICFCNLSFSVWFFINHRITNKFFIMQKVRNSFEIYFINFFFASLFYSSVS